MLKEAKGKITIVSGYRSEARQKQLWDAAVKKYGSAKAARKWVAPPGKSNHGRGVAIDFGGDLKLLAKLAPKYGLVQPMSWEPWHYEPVGSRDAHRDGWTTPPDGHADGGLTPAMREAASRKTVGFQMASLHSLLNGYDEVAQPEDMSMPELQEVAAPPVAPPAPVEELSVL